MFVEVTNQAELDAALAKHRHDPETVIEIRSPGGVSLTLSDTGSSRVVARDSSQIEAWGSSRVVARDSSQVVARDSSQIEAWGSSRVVAGGSSQIEAWGSSRVVAGDSSRVEAGAYVAIHLWSQRVSLSGGVVIDMAGLDLTDAEQWCGYVGAKRHGDASILLFKAVDVELRSGLGFEYPIGATVEAPDWRASHACGEGLHFSPSPALARTYFTSATRFLQVSVLLADLCPIDASKAKARSCTVLREVDLWGDPL